MDQLMLMEANEVIHNSIKYILEFPANCAQRLCQYSLFHLRGREPMTKYARKSNTSGATNEHTLPFYFPSQLPANCAQRLCV